MGVTEDEVQTLAAFTAAPDDVCRRVLLDCHGDMHAAAGRLLLSGGREIMCCTVPAEAVAGDCMFVQSPRGLLEVTVPEGYSGGERLTFELPRSPTRHEVTQAQEVGSLDEPQSLPEGTSATAHSPQQEVVVRAVAVPANTAADDAFIDALYVRPAYGYRYRYGLYDPYYYNPFFPSFFLFPFCLW